MAAAWPFAKCIGCAGLEQNCYSHLGRGPHFHLLWMCSGTRAEVDSVPARPRTDSIEISSILGDSKHLLTAFVV